MKRCPSCNRTYADISLNFCLEDGTPLLLDAPSQAGHPTLQYPPIRDTDPPPTAIYNPEGPPSNQAPPYHQPVQWSPTPQMTRQKSSALWWVLGGLAVLAMIGIGLFVMILALASLSDDEIVNTNTNTMVANTNVNTNTNINTNITVNANSDTEVPSSGLFVEDFSTEAWRTGNFAYGDIWYADGAYRMRSKDKMYLIMYAPSEKYNTANATVRVTARSVDGSAPASGYGLVVHGDRTENNQKDYALIIYSGPDPQYQIVYHKGGEQTAVVPWTKTKVIRTGTNTNQLEIRTKGAELSFYINGQYVDRIVDSQNIRSGVAGFYTSFTSEIAFDDLEIVR